jgi:hypothetical protein
MLLSSYTFGKVLDIASDAESGTLNAWNFDQDRGPANFDIKHYWTTSCIYELPFGHGKRFGKGLNPLADKLVGGWQLGGILFLRTGLPFTVSQTQGLFQPARVTARIGSATGSSRTPLPTTGSISPPSDRLPTTPVRTEMRAVASFGIQGKPSPTCRW